MIEQVKGKLIAIAGEIRMFSKDDIKIYINGSDNRYTDKIRKGVNYLVCNDPKSKVAKAVEARKLRIKIISETEMISMIDRGVLP
jgi:NAD-dependent DNA ligase